jgi:hypothetical protein
MFRQVGVASLLKSRMRHNDNWTSFVSDDSI